MKHGINGILLENGLFLIGDIISVDAHDIEVKAPLQLTAQRVGDGWETSFAQLNIFVDQVNSDDVAMTLNRSKVVMVFDVDAQFIDNYKTVLRRVFVPEAPALILPR